MQNFGQLRSLAQLLEVRSGKNATSGGASDTDVKDPTTIAMGSDELRIAVTTHTPVGYWPRTCRYHFGSMTLYGDSDIEVSL